MNDNAIITATTGTDPLWISLLIGRLQIAIQASLLLVAVAAPAWAQISALMADGMSAADAASLAHMIDPGGPLMSAFSGFVSALSPLVILLLALVSRWRSRSKLLGIEVQVAAGIGPEDDARTAQAVSPGRD